jgi:heme A synthase
MSSNEGSAQTRQSRDEPTASATKAKSAKTANWWIWARRVAGVVLAVLVLAVVFLAGGRYYGGGSTEREDVLVPEEASCVQPSCHPMGRGGQQCYYRYVPCP